MNAPQLHLMLNHLPVVGALFVAAVLAVGLVTRSAAILRLGHAMLLAIAIAMVPVYLSGEPAEESIEHAAGVSERAIEAHESAARVSMIGLEALGLAALAGLVWSRRLAPSRRFTALLLACAIGLSGVLAWTAHLGGQIRHPEIRAGVVAQEVQEVEVDE